MDASSLYSGEMIGRHHELIDCHIRLQHAAFEGQRTEVLERAWRAGVTGCVGSSGEQRDWSTLLDLAAQEPRFIPCFGLDPVGLAGRSRDWQHQLQLCLNMGPAGVGMVGLDRMQHRVSLVEQEEVLRTQLYLAIENQRPVLIRCRGAWGRLLKLLDTLTAFPAGFCIYSYQGPPRFIERLVRLGAYFCFNGAVLGHKHTRIARHLITIPLDRLLLASDAPGGLPPTDYAPYQSLDADRQPSNEPANLPHIVTGLAPRLHLEADRLAQLLHHNALCLFGSLIPAEA